MTKTFLATRHLEVAEGFAQQRFRVSDLLQNADDALGRVPVAIGICHLADTHRESLGDGALDGARFHRAVDHRLGTETPSLAAANVNCGFAERRRFEQSGGRIAHDGIAFQRFWESRAYVLGGETYAAPGQRVGDFLAGRASTAFEAVVPSYQPGVLPTDLAAPGREALPTYAIDAIREALPAFAKQIAGFAMADAVLTGVETRTSSPLRIPRGKDLQSVNVAGLYPAGEGAGYAGGILSAGVDGIRTAEAVALSMLADIQRGGPTP